MYPNQLHYIDGTILLWKMSATVTHLSKGPSDLKSNGTPENAQTLLLAQFFHAMVCFVLTASLKTSQ